MRNKDTKKEKLLPYEETREKGRNKAAILLQVLQFNLFLSNLRALRLHVYTTNNEE